MTRCVKLPQKTTSISTSSLFMLSVSMSGTTSQTEDLLFVVIWEPKRGHGGGHQSVKDKASAEALRWRLSRERPDDEIRIEAIADYSAAAVAEGMRRRHRAQEAR